MTDSLVSIIIPVYNCAEYLSKCLTSVCNQSYTKIEIIVINDGSTDESSQIIQKAASIDSRIKYLYQDNRGVSGARNRGLEKASGKWCCFVDADDYVDNNYISTLLGAVNNNDFVAFALKHPRENRTIENKSSEEMINTLISNKNIAGYPWNKFYRLSVIRNNSIFFNENISVSEDLLFNIEYVSHIKSATVITDDVHCLYHYNERDGSALRSKDERKICSVLQADEIILNKYSHFLDAKSLTSIQKNYCDIAIRCILFHTFRTEKFDRNYINEYLALAGKYSMSVKQKALYITLRLTPHIFLTLYMVKHHKKIKS